MSHSARRHEWESRSVHETKGTVEKEKRSKAFWYCAARTQLACIDVNAHRVIAAQRSNQGQPASAVPSQILIPSLHA